MRFLLDQDVYAVTARFLLELGHDVLCAAAAGLSAAEDAVLLGTARQQQPCHGFRLHVSELFRDGIADWARIWRCHRAGEQQRGNVHARSDQRLLCHGARRRYMEFR